MKPISIIVAVDQSGGFGKDGKIPWHFDKDLSHFKKTTDGGICIMGRKTYQDMFDMIKAKSENGVLVGDVLVNRQSIVLTRNESFVPIGAEKATCVRTAVENLPESTTTEIFVIGGEKIFIESLPWANKIYLTLIKGDYDCDRFFPIKYMNKYFRLVSGQNHDDMSFLEYHRSLR